MLRRKLERQLKNPPEEELIVNLPKSLKIEEIDPLAEETANTLGTRSFGGMKRKSSDGTNADNTQVLRTVAEQTARFTPILLIIEYVILEVRDGMHFVGWEEGDLRYPHAYTSSSQSSGAGCCLFPCVDDPTSRSTWDITIRCSKSIGDALSSYQYSKAMVNQQGKDDMVKGTNGEHGADGKQSDFSADDRAMEFVVICTGDMTDEVRRKPTELGS